MSSSQAAVRPPTTIETPTASRKRPATSPLAEEHRRTPADVGSISNNENEARASPSETITRNRDARLGSASAGSVSITGKLLDLRKSYHKLSRQLQQATHHQQFLDNCLEKQLIPEGLKIKLEPQAFMASVTGIKAIWNNRITDMSRGLMQTLQRHYLTVMDHLQRELDGVQEQITSLSDTSTSTQELQHHRDMIKKTDDNLEKQKLKLSKRAEQKLEKLRNPTTSVPKTKRSRKGKGHSPPRTAAQPTPAQRTSTNPTHLPSKPSHPRSYAEAAKDFRKTGPGDRSHPRNGTRTQPRRPQTAHQKKGLLPTPQYPPMYPPNQHLPPLRPPPHPPQPLFPPTPPPSAPALAPLLLTLTQVLQQLTAATGGHALQTGGPPTGSTLQT